MQFQTQKQPPAQKKDAPTAASIFDTSSQSESLQRKADMANNATQRAEAPRPNNTGMPDNLKSGIESLSGFSMDNVRVHYNSSKPATVQALAYTQGTDIHVAPGQEKCLPHEAWHVAQQMAGRVSPTTNINGMPVNDNAGLEHEADVMGEKAVQCKDYSTSSFFVQKAVSEGAVQCEFYVKDPEKQEIRKHDGEPSLLFFQKTEEFYRPWFSWTKYPVYVRRVLDARNGPCLGEQYDLSLKNYRKNGTKNNDFLGLEEGKFIIDSDFFHTYLGDKATTLDSYINSLKEYCQEDGIINLIEGAVKNEHNRDGIINFRAQGEEKERRIGLFCSRLKLMTEYVKNVGERKLPDNEKSISQNLIKDRYFIKSTGSDPHANGQHALFLINRETREKKLYKPHSLMFENAFMGNQTGGQQSFLQMLNSFISSDPKKYSFSLLNIDSASQIEEFVERVGDREHSIAEDTFNQYMFQLGMLEIAAKVFGITDLHCENIIFGKQGPVAIDSECGCAFGEYTLIEKGPAPPVTTPENQMVNSSALYVGDKQKTDRGDEYQKGKTFMSNLIKNNVDKIDGNMDEIIRNIDKCRILPIATPDLTDILALYAKNGKSYMDEELNGKTCCEFIEGEINDYFSKSKYFCNAGVLIDKEIMFFLFDKAIKQGTLPAFEYDMKNNVILLDGQSILQKTLPESVFIPQEAMKQHIIDQIYEL